MLEATMTKCVVQPVNGDTVLFAKFERFGDEVGVRAPFDWTIINRGEFLEDLKNQVAQAFDVPVHYIDIDDKRLFDRMEKWTEKLRRLRLVYTKEDLN